jgi:hypothetical protein
MYKNILSIKYAKSDQPLLTADRFWARRANLLNGFAEQFLSNQETRVARFNG